MTLRNLNRAITDEDLKGLKSVSGREICDAITNTDRVTMGQRAEIINRLINMKHGDKALEMSARALFNRGDIKKGEINIPSRGRTGKFTDIKLYNDRVIIVIDGNAEFLNEHTEVRVWPEEEKVESEEADGSDEDEGVEINLQFEVGHGPRETNQNDFHFGVEFGGIPRRFGMPSTPYSRHWTPGIRQRIYTRTVYGDRSAYFGRVVEIAKSGIRGLLTDMWDGMPNSRVPNQDKLVVLDGKMYVCKDNDVLFVDPPARNYIRCGQQSVKVDARTLQCKNRMHHEGPHLYEMPTEECGRTFNTFYKCDLDKGHAGFCMLKHPND